MSLKEEGIDMETVDTKPSFYFPRKIPFQDKSQQISKIMKEIKPKVFNDVIKEFVYWKEMLLNYLESKGAIEWLIREIDPTYSNLARQQEIKAIVKSVIVAHLHPNLWKQLSQSLEGFTLKMLMETIKQHFHPRTLGMVSI